MFGINFKKKLETFFCSSERGMIALVSVLIVMSLVLVVVSSVLSRSLRFSDLSSSQKLSSKVLSSAEACAEHALMKLREDEGYSGNETLAISTTSSCQVLAVEGNGQERLIKVKANNFNHIKRIRIELAQLRPSLKVTSWQEVQSF